MTLLLSYIFFFQKLLLLGLKYVTKYEKSLLGLRLSLKILFCVVSSSGLQIVFKPQS